MKAVTRKPLINSAGVGDQMGKLNEKCVLLNLYLHKYQQLERERRTLCQLQTILPKYGTWPTQHQDLLLDTSITKLKVRLYYYHL